MPNTDSTNSGRKAGPLAGLSWNFSTPNTVAILGVVAVGLLIALRNGFRPVNLG